MEGAAAVASALPSDGGWRAAMLRALKAKFPTVDAARMDVAGLLSHADAATVLDNSLLLTVHTSNLAALVASNIASVTVAATGSIPPKYSLEVAQGALYLVFSQTFDVGVNAIVGVHPYRLSPPGSGPLGGVRVAAAARRREGKGSGHDDGVSASASASATGGVSNGVVAADQGVAAGGGSGSGGGSGISQWASPPRKQRSERDVTFTLTPPPRPLLDDDDEGVTATQPLTPLLLAAIAATTPPQPFNLHVDLVASSEPRVAARLLHHTSIVAHDAAARAVTLDAIAEAICRYERIGFGAEDNAATIAQQDNVQAMSAAPLALRAAVEADVKGKGLPLIEDADFINACTAIVRARVRAAPLPTAAERFEALARTCTPQWAQAVLKAAGVSQDVLVRLEVLCKEHYAAYNLGGKLRDLDAILNGLLGLGSVGKALMLGVETGTSTPKTA